MHIYIIYILLFIYIYKQDIQDAHINIEPLCQMHKESFRRKTCPPSPCHGLPAFLGREDTFDTKRMKHLWQDLHLYLFSIAAYRCTKHYQFWHAKKTSVLTLAMFLFPKSHTQFCVFFIPKKTATFKAKKKHNRFPRPTFAKDATNRIPRDAIKKVNHQIHQIQSSNPSPNSGIDIQMALKKNRKGESMEFGNLRVFESWCVLP